MATGRRTSSTSTMRRGRSGRRRGDPAGGGAIAADREADPVLRIDGGIGEVVAAEAIPAAGAGSWIAIAAESQSLLYAVDGTTGKASLRKASPVVAGSIVAAAFGLMGARRDPEGGSGRPGSRPAG